jgi:beta-glucanase (GH16 family)
MAPPTCTPEGYSIAYIDDFPGTSLAHGWATPGNHEYKLSWVSPKQVQVHDGMMDITMTYSGKSTEVPVVGWAQLSNEPGAVLTYGKYLVRQRADTYNDLAIATLTWPFAANTWPPEIDFAEDDSGNRHFWSHNHYADANGKNQYTSNDSGVTNPDWHTWGLEWTPTSVTYTLDGKAWKTETDPHMIPKIKMYLGFVMACFTKPAAGSAHWQVDWVAVYSRN